MKSKKPKITQEKLLIALIKDDLINNRLIYGLEALDFDALHYCLHLSETIFAILGIEEKAGEERIGEYYHNATRKAAKINIKDSNRALEPIANEIYKELIKMSSSIF
ncbi:MAG TPA: hypothetical protein VK177_04470 [Flavobacteriales bacterium]|nr:hypothetical protein [Flavobacteriales bacterium]